MKPGYKQTEVGVIPEEWDESPVADVITSFQNGFAFASHGYVKSGIPIVTMAQIGLDGRFNFTPESVNYWPAEAASALSAFQLFRGDIIIAMTDVTPQKNLIGRMAEVNEIGPLLLNQRVGLLRLDSEKIDPYFLRAISNSSRWRGYARAVASLGVQANIGTKDILAGKIPHPPLPEQRAIATALSDVDGLLGGLDRLIAKKRDLKQAAMQQLLTGQTRLPGFQGEWEVKTLFDLAARKKELFDDGDWIESEHITTEGIRLIQTGNIGVGSFVEKDDKKYINEDSFASLRCKQLKQGDLLVCRLADPAGRACVLGDIGEERIVTSVDVTIFRPPSELVDRLFLSQVFSTSDWFRAVSDRSGGTTHKRISRGALGRLSINLPYLPEQTAIASVLTEMDGELAVLEQRREKTRALKQAMMQELLTGRTRLV